MDRKTIAARYKRLTIRTKALAWKKWYTITYHINRARSLHSGRALLSMVAVAIVFSVLFFSSWQSFLEGHFDSDKALDGLQSLILNVGSALIGAAAIVTSLVLFAMQVNIERMPHGLFRRLSADMKLLSAFALSFLMALVVALLSTAVSKDFLGWVTLAAFWLIVFILGAFHYAYRRALTLVNPARQLDILIGDTRRIFHEWANRATRISPLVELDESDTTRKHDVRRMRFFMRNSNWDSAGKVAVQHAISYSRRYTEQGDYEVSRIALNAIVAVNLFYIAAKDKTFFADTIIGTSLSHDGFIMDTLEHLRQNSLLGVSRRDEQQLIQTMRTLAALVRTYCQIDYCTEYGSKTHASYAAGYLGDVVKELVLHEMPDVLMEGQRLLGASAKDMLNYSRPEDIQFLAERIASVVLAGIVNPKLRPASQTGISQLANISFQLLLSKTHDIGYASRTIRDQVAALAKATFKVPASGFSKIHSNVLEGYYSATSQGSLIQRLVDLANEVLEAPADSKDAEAVLRNFGAWCDGMHRVESELLKSALEVQSSVIFDLISWNCTLVRLLVILPNAPACGDFQKNEFHEQAKFMVGVFYAIPDDVESVHMADNYSLIEMVFEAAMEALTRDAEEVGEHVLEFLISWAFKGGKYNNSWSILDKALLAAAAMAIFEGNWFTSRLKTEVAKRVLKEDAPAKDIRHRAARELRERANNLSRRGRMMSHVDAVVHKVDHAKLQVLLKEVADMLTPVALEHPVQNGGA